MGKPEMQKKKKIQRKKLQEEEKIIAEELERLMELTMEEHQELETEKADEMVWLMKCPPRLDKAWRQLSSSSQELVLVAKYTKSVDLLQPDLSTEVIRSHIPRFGLGKLAVEGTVTHKLDMRPHDCIEEYGKLLRERNMKLVAENRRIQVLDDCRGEHLTPTPALVTEKLKRREKRTRSDRSEVEAKMFQLFEREPKWTLRQLVQKSTSQRFLKEILKELCVYARSGHAYELKPEYKKCI
ncbi:hypothetical protein Bca52824_031991 [Brassica carinata]|uniref:TFIIF beta subunit HTH domain-containing protein n=1 Tax=Brassica carinata TaxID=52824 RepID=A0A8X7SDA7_BRACI|nr:hypothetical protein Bca52824_031991 [Brassica carinata]